LTTELLELEGWYIYIPFQYIQTSPTQNPQTSNEFQYVPALWLGRVRSWSKRRLIEPARFKENGNNIQTIHLQTSFNWLDQKLKFEEIKPQLLTVYARLT